jgi:hypothetical protein
MADLVAFLHNPQAAAIPPAQTNEQSPAMEHTESTP